MAGDPSGTVRVGNNSSLSDGTNLYWIQDGKVVQYSYTTSQAVVDQTTARVIAIAWVDNTLWQENADRLWWQKTPQGTWSPPGGTHTIPAITISPSGWISSANVQTPGMPFGTNENVAGLPLVDAARNIWWVDNGKIVENGIVDQGTANVIAMAYVNGQVWQENSQDLWWQKTGRGYDGWGSSTGYAPVPVVREYIGHGASTAATSSWNPGQLPQHGDYLLMQDGAMDLWGDTLAGDQIVLGRFYTSNRPPSTETINVHNVKGPAAFTISMEINYLNTAIVNIGAGSVWKGGFTATIGDAISVNGPGQYNNTSSTMFESAPIVSAEVIGEGVFHLSGASPEFLHTVGSGQTVEVGGNVFRGGPSYLRVADLPDFHAKIDLEYGTALFETATADAYSFKNDILTLYKGNVAEWTGSVHNGGGPSGDLTTLYVNQTPQGITVSNASGPGFAPTFSLPQIA